MSRKNSWIPRSDWVSLARLVALVALAASPALAEDEAPAPVAPEAVFQAAQDGREWLARGLIGRPVANAAGQVVGNVQDVVVDAGGTVKAVVIGVGGFLGVGEKPVAVAYETLRIVRDANGGVVASVALTRAQLEAAPSFRPLGREAANTTVKP